MPWVLTVTSQIGAKVNIVTGAPTDSATVYDEADLHRRIAAAKDDPRQLSIHVQHVTGPEA